MIEFPCHACNAVLRTPLGSEGKQSRCPSCGTIQTIPGGGTASSMGVGMPSPPGNPAPPNLTQQPQANYQQPANHPNQPFQPNNPYLSPTGHPRAPGKFHDSRAGDRVKAPAIALIVLHSLNMVGCLFAIVIALINPDGEPVEEMVGLVVVYGVIFLVAAFCLFGGILMLKKRLWGVGLATSILTILSGISCCLVPMAFGIWSLVTLLDPQVKNSFH